jgi:hypothetical protein
MNLGQLIGNAGVVSQGWRQGEEAERVARQNQLVIEEQNRVADLKRQLAGLQMPSFQPVDVAQFTQGFTPGQAMPMGAAPAPAPVAPVAVAPAAPAAPTGGAQPLPAGVRPSTAGADRGNINPPLVGQPQPVITPPGTVPITPTEVRQGQNRVSLMRAPAAALDVIQAPAAAGLNLISQGARGINYLFGTDLPTPSFSMTPFYDRYVRAPEQDLAAGVRRVEPPKPTAAAPATGTPAAGATRSDRNNNPGNLIFNDYTKSLGATGKDKDGFAIFPSMEVGQSASLANLQNYGERGINTVEGIINRWSPPNGRGNTPAGTRNYINFVAQQLGVPPNQPLNMSDPATLQALNAAIKRFEGTGAPGAPTAAAAAPGAAPRVTLSGMAAEPAAAAPGAAPTPMEVPQTQARNMEMAEFYLANPQSIPFELQQMQQVAQQQAAFITRQRNEAAQLAQVYMRSGTQQGIEAAMRLRDTIGQADASLLQLQQQVVQKQTYLQGMQGLRELATANDPRRLAGVLTQYMGAPVGIQPRPDGRYNFFVNGQRVQEGVSPAQIASMALKEFSPEARQAAASSAALENELALKRKYGDALVNAMRDIQKEIVQGEYKIAEERAKQQGGKLTVDTSKGVAYFQQGNRVFVINPDGKIEETPLGKVELPPTARPVAGLNMGR